MRAHANRLQLLMRQCSHVLKLLPGINLAGSGRVRICKPHRLWDRERPDERHQACQGNAQKAKRCRAQKDAELHRLVLNKGNVCLLDGGWAQPRAHLRCMLRDPKPAKRVGAAQTPRGTATAPRTI